MLKMRLSSDSLLVLEFNSDPIVWLKLPFSAWSCHHLGQTPFATAFDMNDRIKTRFSRMNAFSNQCSGRNLQLIQFELPDKISSDCNHLSRL